MLFEASRDFFKPFLRFCFAPDDDVKKNIREKFFPRYLPVYNKVIARFSPIIYRHCKEGCIDAIDRLLSSVIMVSKRYEV